MDDELIGKRIATRRKDRGMTQVALAQAASVSLSLLRKVEQGNRDCSQVTLATVARALGVDVGALSGQPYDTEEPRRDRVHGRIPALRRALNTWDLPLDLEHRPRPMSALEADAKEVVRELQRGRNRQLAEILPPLLSEAFAMVHATDDERERESLGNVLLAYAHAAHTVAHQTGYEDLAAQVEDRIQWIASLTSDPAAKGFAAWMRTTSIMRDALYEPGLRLLDTVRSDIEPTGRDDDAALLTTGSLHLRSSLLAGRAGNLALAMDHVEEARQISVRLPADTDNDWQHMAFGPSNVAIYRVASAVEAGDGPRALALADETRLPDHMMTRLPTRVAHHHTDLARAYFWQGKHDKSLKSLMVAKKAAPQQTRHHPATREVAGLLVRAHRRSNEPLARFRAWLGPDPEW
ncbi:helix-turn-helix domain-containing protein [Promicromonospora vindobonensis]|uniref:Helix-turn-helix domain-containing protein n=1 Tax=Promicromonospora vindobonensis TaxID=195748 RepID=A0ABW5VZQ7_9MICO